MTRMVLAKENYEKWYYKAMQIRRMVRDYFYRGVSGERTFAVWKDVREGESLYIDPYIDYADVRINTFFTLGSALSLRRSST